LVELRLVMDGLHSSTFLTAPTVEIFIFQKSKMAAAAILKNRSEPYISRGLSDFDKIWHADADRPS